MVSAVVRGNRMAASARRIEHETLALDRDIAGRDRRPAGKLRVTASEMLAQSRLTPVALRPMRPTEGNLWAASFQAWPGRSMRPGR